MGSIDRSNFFFDDDDDTPFLFSFPCCSVDIYLFGLVHTLLYSTLLYSTTLPVSIYTISTMFIVCRREVVGCVFFTLFIYYLFLLMDGWLCRVDMVGVFFFFFFEEKHCVPNLCVSTPLHLFILVYPRKTVFSQPAV